MDLYSNLISVLSTIISKQTPLIVLLELTLVSTFYVYRKLTFWRRIGIPNHIGHMVEMFKQPVHKADQKCIQKMGKIIGTYELLRPTLLVSDPEMIQEILVSKFKDWSNHRVWAVKGQHFAECLFLIPYEDWKPTRSLVAPTFSPMKIKLMQPIFDDATRILVENLDKVASNGKEIDICPYVNSVIFDVVARALFSCKVDCMNDPNNIIAKKAKLIFGTNPSFTQMMAILSPGIARLFNWTAFNGEATSFLASLSKQNIKEKLELARNKGQINNDMLQYLLDAKDDQSGSKKQRLTETEVIDNCILFYIAGFDTTSVTLAYVIYNMAVNPSIQENLFAEIDDAFHGSNPDFDKVMKLDYLNACVYESMRINASATRIDRISTKDTYLGPNKIFIPKGTNASIPIYTVHRDEDNFESPDVFKPERFFPENKKAIKPGTYIPFADGPKNCIGYKFALTEVKLATVRLLQRFKFVATPKTKDFSCFCGLPIGTPDAIYMKIERR